MNFSLSVSETLNILSLLPKWLNQNAKGVYYYQVLLDAQKHEKMFSNSFYYVQKQGEKKETIIK